jgi:hypothetical protein
MEDEEALLRVHVPAARVALVLDLVESAEMPLAVALHTPERVVGKRVDRFDVAHVVGAALSRYTSVLRLNVRPHRLGALHDRRYGGHGGGCRSRARPQRGDVAVRDGVRRAVRHEGSRCDNRMRGIPNRRSDSRWVVVRPLIRVIVVSIHANPKPIASVGRVVTI